jgi:hypothetical protein
VRWEVLNPVKRDLNEGLKAKQDIARKETIQRVELAIKELHEEGSEVTTKRLMERTGLSRSTFGKPHVVEVLKSHNIGRYKSRKIVNAGGNEHMISYLQKEIDKYNKENEKLKALLDKRDITILRLESNLQDSVQQCEVLRGEVMRIYQKATNRGIELD